MTFQEKGNWLYAALAVVVPALYFGTILPQLPTTPVGDIEYQQSLLGVVGVTVLLAIVGMILIGIAAPEDAAKADQRDQEIDRLGEYVGGIVLAVGMIVPFGLALGEFHQFWIANAMYLAFVVGTLCATIVKLVAYRRGF
jgi:uncharacterized membrane protein